MNTLGNVEKLEIVTVGNSETHICELTNGFTINPYTVPGQLRDAVTNLTTLTTDTYSDTVITATTSLNAIYTPELIPTKVVTDLGWRFSAGNDKVELIIPKGAYTSTNKRIKFPLGVVSGVLWTIIRNGPILTRTSSSGTFSITVSNPNVSTGSTLNIGTPSLLVTYNNGWEGTVDNSSNTFYFTWVPYSGYDGDKIRIDIPKFVVIIEE